MAQLGDTATPASGFYSDITGNKQYWNTGAYAMPAGGGTVTDLYVYCGGYNAATTGQLVIWDSGGNILWQSGNITIPQASSNGIGGQAWQHVTVPSKYVAAGNIYLGFWAAGSVIWTFEASGGVTGKSGLSSPGTATGGANEYTGAYGNLGAYIVYNPGGVVRINTGTPGAPNWVVTPVKINVGTPGAPNWQPCRCRVNQGTPQAPNWVDCT